MPKPKRKPILCIDFDGVIHSYTSGWKGAGTIPDPPVPGAFEAIRKYCEKFTVSIYSSRSSHTQGIIAMKQWFLENGWPMDETGSPGDIFFPRSKPAARVSIDARAITFDGTFPSVGDIFRFRPWNKKKKASK